MAAPYTPQSVTNYNSNPPSDDGSTTEANRGKWATIKTKLTDPLNTFATAVNSAISTAFGKIIGGAGITSTAISYTIVSGDQGKLVKATGSGITITTPDATDVGSPFVCGVLNNSGGDITLDGNGSQTIDGAASATIPSGAGAILTTDGTNWNTFGQSGIASTSGFSLLGGILVPSVSGNALTIAVKTLAGNDPSTDTPVRVVFRGQTLLDEEYAVRTITAALSVTIPSTAEMGVIANVPFRLWVTLHDDGGTIRIGAFNAYTSTGLFNPSEEDLLSTTAVGTGSDSAGVVYSNSAVTSKPFRYIGYLEWDSGLAVPGTWSALSTKVALMSPGMKKLGDVIRTHEVNLTTATETSGSTSFADITGMAITPTLRSAANFCKIDIYLSWSHNTAGGRLVLQALRGAVVIGGGVTAGNREGALMGPSSADGSILSFAFATLMDKPISTTPAYKLQWQTVGGIVCLNRSSNDTDDGNHFRGVSRIVVTEYQG